MWEHGSFHLRWGANGANVVAGPPFAGSQVPGRRREAEDEQEEEGAKEENLKAILMHELTHVVQTTVGAHNTFRLTKVGKELVEEGSQELGEYLGCRYEQEAYQAYFYSEIFFKRKKPMEVFRYFFESTLMHFVLLALEKEKNKERGRQWRQT